MVGTVYVCKTSKEFSFRQRQYWREVGESEGFDIEDVSAPLGITGLISFDCQRDRFYPDRTMIKQYAQLGLHRYNMLEGTSYEFAVLLKFNMLQNLVSSYYITFFAYDLEVSLLRKTFQVRVDEKKYGSLDVVVSVARLKEVATNKKPFMPHFHGGAVADPFFRGELPDWPSDDAFNDRKRFYVLEESDWQDTDWISLYLKTLVYANDRNISDHNLSKLKIINVVIETNDEDVKPPNERLIAKSAHVYITFKGLADSFFQIKTLKRPRTRQTQQLGEHVERKGLVRRVISSGALILEGKLWSCQNTEQSSMTPLSEKKPLVTYKLDYGLMRGDESPEVDDLATLASASKSVDLGEPNAMSGKVGGTVV